MDLFDTSGKLSQGVATAHKMEQLNPSALLYLVFVAGLAVLILGLGYYWFLRITRLKKNGAGYRNGTNHQKMENEVSIIHKRVDKQSEKMDRMAENISKIASDVAYLKGRAEK